MLATELFIWWYGRGWIQLARSVQKLLTTVAHTFSVPILLRTLFAPWRRIITYPGASLDTKLRAFGDNLVSRAVGFTVRCIVLLTALIMCALTSAAGVIGLALWPLVPVSAIVLLIKGIIG